jgi:hypothetical protein
MRKPNEVANGPGSAGDRIAPKYELINTVNTVDLDESSN